MAPYVPRERKKRRLAKQAKPQSQTQAGSVPDELIPETKTEREIRRATFAEEVRAQQPESKVSSKKRKRLDKYIDTKLRKEENLDLLKKLAAQKVDTSLLQSSKKLGRVGETKRERLSRALQEKQAGIDEGRHDEVLYERRREAEPTEDHSDDSEEVEVSTATPVVPHDSKPAFTFGAGLKRPLETDESGRPVLKKRKRRKKVLHRSQVRPDDSEHDANVSEDMDEDEELDEQAEDEEEWNGFGSDTEVDTTAPLQALLKPLPESEDGSESSDASGEDKSVGSSEEEEEEDVNEGSGSSVGEDESDELSDTESAPSTGDRKECVSAFKQWADMARNTALDFTPSALPTDSAVLQAKSTFKPRQPSPDANTVAVTLSNGSRAARPAAAITIPRSEEIQAARLELPVVQEEQKIMEAIHSNPITIVCGATGSGKTTQVPQMMFESGYGSHIGARSGIGSATAAGPQSKGMIGVTQPRRVAATSVAERVKTELGDAYQDRVGHQVRYDKGVGRSTAIKFMTDGILLREIDQDFVLSKYSAIVIDEAHERRVNTDILIGMLSRIVPLRAKLAKEDLKTHYPLKLVIMSATLRVSDFLDNPRLFKDGVPPMVEAEGRQYPVTVHFSRRTPRDYTAETVEKVARGHRKLPPGSMLVFLTSQNEIQAVSKALKERLGSAVAAYGTSSKADSVMPLDVDDLGDGPTARRNNDYFEGEESDASDADVEITGVDPNADDKEFHVDDAPQFGVRDSGVLKPHILPLYAALPSAEQLRVFQPPPDGSRLIVLATNVAETSLTIPGVRYVFDCGRAKEKRYDISTGVQTFEIDWISKASASQRMGRAGRTGPGHVYRLYSSAVYERYFDEHTVPEILRTPLESTVLQLKAMEIENVVHFPFPTSPDAEQLRLAERLLKNLGAIREREGTITDEGKAVMGFPVSPRFGKMLLRAQKGGLLLHTVAIVAGLAVGDLFNPEAQTESGTSAIKGAGSDDEDSDPEARRNKRAADSEAHAMAQTKHQEYTRAQAQLSKKGNQSDVLRLLAAVRKHAEESALDKSLAAARKVCATYNLREKAMSEVQQLRHQLHSIVNARFPTTQSAFAQTFGPPSAKDAVTLSEIVAAGFIDQVAIRADLLKDETAGFGRKPRRAGEVAYRTLVPTGDVDNTLAPQEQEMQKSVFVHASSVLARLGVAEMPAYVVYSHLSRAAPSTVESGKTMRTRMHPLTVLTQQQLAVLAEGTPLLELGKPIGKIEELGGGRRQCWVSVGLRAPGGSGTGWPLGAWKVVQKKGTRGEWDVERVVAR